MSPTKSSVPSFVYYLTYVFSIVSLSILMGYLIAISPMNKNMGTGFLFAVFCYGWMVVSIVFHYHKIVGIHVGYSVLWTFIVSMVSIVLIVWIESGIDYHGPLRNYFLQWFATGTGFGAIHGIAMFVMVMLKEAKKVK